MRRGSGGGSRPVSARRGAGWAAGKFGHRWWVEGGVRHTRHTHNVGSRCRGGGQAAQSWGGRVQKWVQKWVGGCTGGRCRREAREARAAQGELGHPGVAQKRPPCASLPRCRWPSWRQAAMLSRWSCSGQVATALDDHSIGDLGVAHDHNDAVLHHEAACRWERASEMP